MTQRRQEPTFFVSVLTDIDGERHYCACLTFHEPYDDQRNDTDDDNSPADDEMVHHSVMFAPKSIVLISQHDCFDTFKVCVSIWFPSYDSTVIAGNVVAPLFSHFLDL